MEQEKLATKNKVIETALSLFKTNGYQGTSVRDISKKANVNIATISYYFKGKQGLLEHIIVDFLEGYVAILNKYSLVFESKKADSVLIDLVEEVLNYNFHKKEYASIFYRELTLDSVFIREIMMTYLARERYTFIQIYDALRLNNTNITVPFSVFFVQLKSFLSTPYLFPSYMNEVLYIQQNDTYFFDRYKEYVEKWIFSLLGIDTHNLTELKMYS
ncbi:forespore capture DNA-binding protein RefZ [Gottfriedia solisilvae]|uniref:TetR family transcriptional regulator n=1 Tax=Gottfriedia solisilvae TaxID=1516104 RepID=A0A8J3AC08_9BACI|nr:forespore capture DNA-binding protein RefZ [Gottfriedia solisilvae]GGI10157.1 TetR family transcriptional regulator [Gottfriedia solisilvae]